MGTFDELEKHTAHLMLNQIEAGIYLFLLEREIKKWEGTLTRVKSYGYESDVKRDVKIGEIEAKLEILKGMQYEMQVETAW